MNKTVSQAPLPPIACFTLITMTSPIALNILVPALPNIAISLGVSEAHTQLSLTLYLFSLAIGQLICGPLADRFGRRPILLAGITIHTLGCLLGAFSNDLVSLLLARILQALGGCTGMVLARTIILDRYNRSQAAGLFGYITLSIALSQTIAPTLGGHLSLFGWKYLFYFSLILGSIAWLMTFFMMPETGKNLHKNLNIQRVLVQYYQVLKTNGYLGYALSTTFIACGFYLFISSVPYVVNHSLKGTAADFGNWFLCVSGGFMLGSFTAARISTRLGVQAMIIWGHILSTLGALLMLLLCLFMKLDYFVLFIPMALFTFGRGLSQPNSQSAAISASKSAPGTASGLMGFIQLISGAIIAQMVPLILTKGAIWIAALILLCALLAFLALFVVKISSSNSVFDQ